VAANVAAAEEQIPEGFWEELEPLIQSAKGRFD
jgi:hypothetical protein